MVDQARRWKLILLESARGERYVESFIRSLDPATIAKVLRTIDLLETYGPDLGMPHTKRLSKTIHELRVRGRVEVRILYTYIGHAIYLLHAFQKKAQQTPRRMLELAEARRRVIGR